MKNLSILCKDFQLDEALKHYSEEKLSLVNKFFTDDVAELHLRIGKTTNHHLHGKIYYTEITVKIPEKTFEARIEAETVYKAIDQLKDELSNIISHYKDKVRTKQLHEARDAKEAIHKQH